MHSFLRFLLRLSLLLIIGAVGMLLWDRYAPPAPPPTLEPISGQIDRIVIEKSQRTLTVLQRGKALRTYKVALGFATDGDKLIQGDGKTPEGVFKIDRRNDESAFHLSLGINYPLPQDIARAKLDGSDPGGDIFIHGQPNNLQNAALMDRDWTEGCIALSNEEIEELWAVTPIGTEVEIRP
ncbi:L,D-transpeptidase [Aliiroseovarius sp. S1339]|uniref:L,D-transpeptidase family protein n=1 Tax=Aliiroseovarius sp. S1339 TaxID=2936990 RepID=UPI0020BFE701|nr:L,D-transpeptidase [Aliiroseovarius sp. S1339]MCK8463926.1 L,D-transpeptidase [Aliiroseovarius sp. S1339]